MSFIQTAMRLISLSLIVVFNFVFSSRFISAQQMPVFGNSDNLIQTANQMYDSGNYATAITLFLKVPGTDPNYTTACYELALNYYASGDNDMALAKCREAQYLRYDDPYLFSLMGSILDDMGKPDEGVRIIKQGLKKWPYNQNLMYNLGVNYLNAGKPDSAEKVFLRTITYYPYHTRSHLGLANANYTMGRTAQSYLAYNMAILISPNTTNITEYENAIGGKLKTIPKPYNYPYTDGSNQAYWDNLKYLLQSEIAFNKSFGYSFVPDFTFTRQSLMLFRNLKYNPADTSMYNRLYTRLFSEILNTGQFETYINYCMNQLKYEGSETWNRKNPGKIDEFITWAQGFLDNGRPFAYDPQLQKQDKQIHHFEDGKLTSIGQQSGEEGVKNGRFLIISNTGAISESGTYANDLTEGKWYVLWPDGKIRQDLNFIHDKMTDTIRTFYPNGAIDLKLAMREGSRHGKAYEYTASGALMQVNTFENDLLNGPGVYNDFDEHFRREYTYRNDSTEGKTTETWFNGKPKSEYFTKKGEYDGIYKSWYHNGKPESVVFYKNGTKSGSWCNYHYNGTVSDSGRYDEMGNVTGKYWSYNDRGNLVSLGDQYTEGKITGTIVHYYEKGGEKSRFTYSNDSLKQMISYDAKGKILYKADAVNDSIYYKSFYGDGITETEGSMVHGKNEGLWKTYNPLGVMISEYYYKDGMHSGSQKSYFPNGAIKDEYVSDSNNITGLYKSYYINGHLHSIGNYIKEGADGEYIYYYPNDSISSRSFYAAGLKLGRDIQYNPDGKVHSEEFYNSNGDAVRNIMYDHTGKVCSDWIYDYGKYEFTDRYPDGKVKSVTRISDNVRNGLQEDYYPNGKLSYSAVYNNGAPDGTIKTFDHKGNLTSAYNYIFGNAEGEGNSFTDNRLSYKTYHENDIENGKIVDYYDFNGKVSREINIYQDERHGFSDYYSPAGDFMYRVRYVNGSIKGYSWKNASGNFVPEVKVDLKTPEMVTYYPNGKISARISLSKGLYHGKTVTYYANGNVHSESEYKNDEITGVQKRYYPDGKKREITGYLDNNENGPYSFYYPNGKLKVSGSYENGLKHGDWHYYNESGVESELLKYHYGDIYEIIAK